MYRNIIQFDIFQGSKFGVNGYFFQIVQSLESVDDFPEHRVLQIQTGLSRVRDEELRAVGVGLAAVGHGQSAPYFMLQSVFNLVLELSARKNTLAAFSVSARIAGLHHEAFDVPVKDAAVVILGGRQGQKVFARSRAIRAKKLQLDVAQICVQCHRHFLLVRSNSLNNTSQKWL